MFLSKEDFVGYYETFVEIIDKLERPEKEKNYLKDVITYNLVGGKRIRGALVAASLKAFAPNEQRCLNHTRVAHLVGWCIELLHAGFLVLDDIMDNSPTRRGQPSWFCVQRNAGHGLIAVNDGLHLTLTSKLILHKILGGRSESMESYLRILRLFDEVSYKTCWGQNLDTIYARNMEPVTTSASDFSLGLETFTWKHFESITRWKTGFYTFYLPVACGMALAGIKDDSSYEQAERILLKLGQYFQAQDDFLDCFGDSKLTGKEGTDIVDGKCSWPIVESISRASEKQLAVIKDHYGRKDLQSQAAILRVYKELDLPVTFRQYEDTLRAEILHDISQWNSNGHVFAVPSGPCELFTEISQLLFGRTC